MAKGFKLPEISSSERTPLVERLLAIIESLAREAQCQEELIGQLKDEIAVLKGEKKRPKFKPSQMDEKTGKDEKDGSGDDSEGKRPGSSKRKKTKKLKIQKERIIKPSQEIPEGSRFKGFRDYVVQDLVIQAHNTRYRLERWITPDGQTLIGRLPESVQDSHFGPTLKSYIIYQHHHCQVTQPLLLEQLREWGVDISSGQIDAVLSTHKDTFHAEKDDILRAGLAASGSITVDDTGARHQGKNGYTTQVGNEYFAWFATTDRKSRINFLELLRGGRIDYRIDDDALSFMQAQGLPKDPLIRLQNAPERHFANSKQWHCHLNHLNITNQRHVRIATEGALLSSVLHHGFPRDLAIVSDDAGQFNILLHGLCWVHAERLIHKLIPLNDNHRQAIELIRGQIWDFYADLKEYKKNPNKDKKACLDARFDEIFTTQTCFQTLNQALNRLHRNKPELLLVLDRPGIPLHTNGSETDIRDYVKKKKVSGGTRSDLGRRCRDTFASSKKTCRKLGISFWDYILDRISGTNAIPPLPEIIRQKATANA